MTTDASATEWGCTCQGTETGGSWSSEEAAYNSNYLETKTVLLSFNSFSDTISEQSVTRHPY